MAENLVIKHGNKGSLPSTKTKGTIYFAQDSSNKSHGKIYYDDPISNTRADMTGCGYDMGNGAEIFNSYSGTVKNSATASCAHAEGQSTQATNLRAHAEGYGTVASGEDSHAEGNCTNASGTGAHAEGIGSNSSKTEFGAKGRASHSEGELTLASGNYSHAGGVRTIAASEAQTAIGKYNVKDDSGTYLFIVGNGTGTSARSNAFTVDKDGNIKSKGDVYANDSKVLPTKEYLDGNFAKLNASNTFDGEQKFKHSTYCPTITDNANGIGCAFKASRGFFNQFLVDEIYIPKEVGNITINKYDSTSGGSMSGIKSMAKFSSNCSFSHGDSCSANGSYSYAGGSCVSTGSDNSDNSKNGAAAHAEGRYTYAEGLGAHAEGNGDGASSKNIASGIGAHAEGYRSSATGSGAHSEGRLTTSSGQGAHSEGYNSSASGEGAHVEGRATQANGSGTHAEGDTTKATAHASHSEGVNTEASGTGSGPHAEGYYTKATAEGAHAEGAGTSTNPNQATAQGAHAEGTQTRATAQGAHAEGIGCVASGVGTHAEGDHTTASGKASHSAGIGTIANGDYQTIVGKYNDTTKGGLFIVGSGSSDTNRKNSFRVNTAGNCYAGTAFQTSETADFAEYFEWEDGNILEEERKGRFVTLINGKIRLANLNDNYVLGVISSTGAFIGNSASENWQGKYLKNVFGEIQYEEIKIISDYDNSERIEMEPILNSEYNPEEEYIPRSERPEWDVVGLYGQVIVVDDGTCEVNGYCRPYVDGIASSFTIDDIDENIPDFMKEFYLTTKGFRVMERLDGNHIKVLIK